MQAHYSRDDDVFALTSDKRIYVNFYVIDSKGKCASVAT
jgi:hypothetical protein